jgi:uncharacterized repeat protein (TIGR03803 family)
VNTLHRWLPAALGTLTICLVSSVPVLAAQTKPTPIYSFKGGTDGAEPTGALAFGPDGALYGATSMGGTGSCQCGTIFKLTPPPEGKTTWGYKTIYNFASGATDGSQPNGNLAFDDAGNIYGTTHFGGGGDDPGFGVIFMLKPLNADRTKWKESVIYRFQGGVDGEQPTAGVAIGRDGSLYGTTLSGGNALGTCPRLDGECGTVYRLSPQNLRLTRWKKERIHDFAGTDGNDGAFPDGRLIIDAHGNLYGTASSGGGSGGGAVFRLKPPAGTQKKWKITLLASFANGPNGVTPRGGVTFGPDGALYGTTSSEGDPTCSCGTVFKLARSTFALTTLARFVEARTGARPVTAPFVRKDGKVYGTTPFGGTIHGGPGNGTIYELSGPASPNGTLKARPVYTLSGTTTGANELIGDSSGTLYGTLFNGGAHQVGMVFRLEP